MADRLSPEKALQEPAVQKIHLGSGQLKPVFQ
ncbi:conserved hypothetical protein, partial [delta proteobacterium NaphS2]